MSTFIEYAKKECDKSHYLKNAAIAAKESSVQLGLKYQAIQELDKEVKNHGLLAAIKAAQDRLRSNKRVISADDIHRQYAESTEYSKLVALAEGCHHDMHPDFTPNWGQGVRLRKSPDGTDINKILEIHAAKDFDQGTCLILPLTTVIAAAKSEGMMLHVSEKFLRDKDGDPLGRPIPDYSFSRVGTPPNHEDLKEKITSRWGEMSLPTVKDICRAALAVADTTREPVVASRIDIKSAYTRICIKPEQATLFATVVSIHPEYGMLIAIPLVNQWGSQSAGFAYEVPARAMTEKANERTATTNGRPTGSTYVDDRVQFGTHDQIVGEATSYSCTARALLGDDAVNDNKTLIGQTIDAIGWRCDTKSLVVAPSAKAILKLFNLFFVVVPMDATSTTALPVKVIQKLCSYATRYSAALTALKPFSAEFGRNAGGMRNDPQAIRRLSRQSIADIQAWRTALERLVSSARGMAVPMRWLALEDDIPNVQAEAADTVAWADATGNGGIGVWFNTGHWLSVDIGRCKYERAGVVQDLDVNVYEFIALIVAVHTILTTPSLTRGSTSPHKHIHIYTDNTSCVSWVRKLRGEAGFHTFLLRLLCDMQLKYGTLVTCAHVPGAVNTYADAASRNFQVPNSDELRRHMPDNKKMPPPDRLLDNLFRALNARSVTPSTIDQLVRTSLDNDTSSASVRHTDSTSPARPSTRN